MSTASSVLPSGRAMPFSEIRDRLGGSDVAGRSATRALTATVVVVGPEPRLHGAAEVVEQLGDSEGLRVILISSGSEPAPPARVAGNMVALSGLKTPYINNAVAALRLSSLPTFVWWRGGSPDVLESVASLADRIVLDEEQPEPVWRRAVGLFDRAAFSDLRWTCLTRWRVLMAHFFDIPSVRAAAPRFATLRVVAADPPAAKLFTGWLRSSLGWEDRVRMEVLPGDGDTPLEEVSLCDEPETMTLTLKVAGKGKCLRSSALTAHHSGATRTVILGDRSLSVLLTEELRIRSRDLAFEHAVRACVDRP